jgi:hypothetical protein
MSWLQAHVYIAAWASPIITLVGLLIRNTVRPTDKVNWSMIVIYVAFLTCLAVMVTPGTEPAMRWAAGLVGGMTFGLIGADAMMWKH